MEELLKSAIANYNNWNKNRGDFEALSTTSGPKTLTRLKVNYIRHNLTVYDKELESYFGKTGIKEAIMLFRQRVYEEIGKIYPELKGECEKQYLERVERAKWGR